MAYALGWRSGDRLATKFARTTQILMDSNAKNAKGRSRIISRKGAKTPSSEKIVFERIRFLLSELCDLGVPSTWLRKCFAGAMFAHEAGEHARPGIVDAAGAEAGDDLGGLAFVEMHLGVQLWRAEEGE